MGIDAEMFVRTKASVTAEQVRRWAYRLGEAFGPDNFCMLTPTCVAQYGGDVRHCLEIVDVYEQDGPYILPDPGETFIRCYPSTRYYGEGYERGDLPFLVSVARWLEDVIPEASVWYGGGSSGVIAEPFGPAERDKLWQHFVKMGGEPYRHGMSINGSGSQHCEFCGGAKMAQCRWGPDGTGYVCNGCGLHRLVAKDGSVSEDGRLWPDEQEGSSR